MSIQSFIFVTLNNFIVALQVKIEFVIGDNGNELPTVLYL